MSGDPLALQEDDLRMMLAAGCHIGTKNLEADMADYVHKRAQSGIYIIQLAKTWEKLILAARALVTIENSQDICVVSTPTHGQRAAYKFCQYTDAQTVSGRYTPGTFTNQICRSYVEPRVLLVTDPRTDSQPVKEASYVNIPVIGFCDTDSPLNCVDIAIPCNNKGKHSLAVMYWLLTREVLRMRGSISRKAPWDVVVDLFIFKEPEEVEEEAAAEAQRAAALAQEPVYAEEYAQEYAQPVEEEQVAHVDENVQQTQVYGQEAYQQEQLQQQQQPQMSDQQQMQPEQYQQQAHQQQQYTE